MQKETTLAEEAREILATETDPIERNKATIRLMVAEFMCKGNMEIVKELCAPDYKFWPVVYTAPEDREGHARDNHATLHTIFPDLKATIDQQIGEGEWVATHHTLTGTHLAEMPTPMGTFAPTGKKVSWRSMSFHRFRDGKIVEGWLSYNPTSILQQIGQLKPWPGDPAFRKQEQQ